MAGTVVTFIIMFSIGINTGTTALIASFTGQKKYERADHVMGQTLFLAIIASILMVIFAIFGVDPLLTLLGAEDLVHTYASEYLKITFFGSITIFLMFGITQGIRGSGDAKTPLKVLIIANIINIVLDPLLIMGYGFFPRMGVAGSAVATISSRGVGLLLLVGHLLFGHSTIHFKLRHMIPNIPIIKRMFSIGFFAFLQVMDRIRSGYD